MPTDYDPIAREYQRSKQQPWRRWIEGYTVVGLLGDLAGRSALDLACGEGHYTRVLRRLGADPVVGVDRSAGMIALARTQESDEPLGLSYLVQDCLRLDLPRRFDLVTAAYLLNYATSPADLASLCRGIAGALRPGGRFVTVNANPALDFGRGSSYRPYGFTVAGDHPPWPGMPYTWVFELDGGPLRVENYWLPTADHEIALRAAGFTAIRWHRPRLDPQAGHPAPWAGFLDHPPIIALEATLGPDPA